MGLTLNDNERSSLLDDAHTGILTTLRSDGRPVTLPVWFAHLDGEIYVRTPAQTAKVKRIRRDTRGSFLVEHGLKWTELTALHLDVRVSVVEDADTAARAEQAIDAKYAGYALAREDMPAPVAAHYADSVVLRLEPVGKPLSWSNTKLRRTG